MSIESIVGGVLTMIVSALSEVPSEIPSLIWAEQETTSSTSNGAVKVLLKEDSASNGGDRVCVSTKLSIPLICLGIALLAFSIIRKKGGF